MPVNTQPLVETIVVDKFYVDAVFFNNMAFPFLQTEGENGQNMVVVNAYADVEWIEANGQEQIRRKTATISGPQFGVVLSNNKAVYALLNMIVHQSLIDLGYIPDGENQLTDEEKAQIAVASAEWLEMFGT